MQLMTKAIQGQLEKNRELPAADRKVVVKYFTPDGAATWWISERDPHNPDLLFGLCDLGMGFPELGYVSLQELESIELPFGLKIERDMYFTPDKTLKEYASVAREHSRIVTEDSLLNDTLSKLETHGMYFKDND